MIKAVCFDLFSTLVDVGSVPRHVGELTADILGVDHAQWREACFSDLHEICQPTEHIDVMHALATSIDSTISPQTIAAATVSRQRRFDHALTVHVEDDVLQGLNNIRTAGYSLILISNASTAEVRAWQHSRLAQLFDVAVFSCECGMKKPDTEIYQHAAARLSLTTGDCLFVGDGGSNEFVGAAATGMPVLMMKRYLSDAVAGARHQHFREYIAAMVSSPHDVLQWLEKRTA